MTIDELCDRFGVRRKTIYWWMQRGIVPRPYGGRGPNARYGQAHVEAIQAWQALRHNNTSGAQVVAHCRERGITVRQYLIEREQAIKDFGIGVA